MPTLIDYSSSESETEEEQTTKSPRNGPVKSSSSSTLPPLPTTFHTLYATNVRTSTVDDPSLHFGRVRQTPHVDGTWPSHVQLEWHPSPAHLSRLTNLLSTIQIDSDKPLHSLLTSPLGAPTPLHISLSRTLPILTHQRSSFLEQLGAKIREAGVQPFTVLLSGGLRWASNEDGSRLFLVVQPSKGILEMGTLLRTCNRVVKDAGLGDRGLYEDSEQEFHFSIAWRLGNGVARSAEDGNESRKKTNINVDDGTLRKAWEASAGKEVSEIEVLFHKVMVRIGNAVHAVELAGKKPESSKKRGMVV